MKMLRHDEDSNFLLLVAHGRTKWTVPGETCRGVFENKLSTSGQLEQIPL
jgi:hypothetical protein